MFNRNIPLYRFPPHFPSRKWQDFFHSPWKPVNFLTGMLKSCFYLYTTGKSNDNTFPFHPFDLQTDSITHPFWNPFIFPFPAKTLLYRCETLKSPLLPLINSNIFSLFLRFLFFSPFKAFLPLFCRYFLHAFFFDNLLSCWQSACYR